MFLEPSLCCTTEPSGEFYIQHISKCIACPHSLSHFMVPSLGPLSLLYPLFCIQESDLEQCLCSRANEDSTGIRHISMNIVSLKLPFFYSVTGLFERFICKSFNACVLKNIRLNSRKKENNKGKCSNK